MCSAVFILTTAVTCFVYVSGASPEKKVLKPECKDVNDCMNLLHHVKEITKGNYGMLIFEEVFSEFCLEKDHCAGKDLKKIIQCSGQDGEASVKSKREIYRYLCSDSGKKEVALLPKSPCAQNSTFLDKAFQVAKECIANNDEDRIELELPANCRYLKAYVCLIKAYDEHCGPAYSSMERKMLEIIKENLPKCKERK